MVTLHELDFPSLGVTVLQTADGGTTLFKTGSSGWDRTNDQLINSQLLLPLSYAGIKLVSVGRIELPPHAPKARMIPFHHTE